MNKDVLDTVRNSCNSVIRDAKCTKKQGKAVYEMVRGLLKKGQPILTQLGERKTCSAKKEGEKYGKHLGNMSLTNSVNNFADKKMLMNVGKYDVIAYDLSDISKEEAEKIEWLQPIFDGSKRQKSKGASIHGVGYNGALLRFQIHDHDKEFLPQIRKSILEELFKSLEGNGILVFDRGNDDQQLFVFLTEKEKQFIVRLKKNRNVLIKGNDKVEKIKDLQPGRYTVCINDDHGKINTKVEYLLIINEHLKGKQPILLLCSKNIENLSDSELVEKYLERWGVENSFKGIKDLFSLEDIQVMKRERFLSLVALIQFSSLIAAFLYQQLRNLNSFLSTSLQALFSAFRKQESLTYNLSAFTKYLRSEFIELISYAPRKTSPPIDDLQTTLFPLNF